MYLTESFKSSELQELFNSKDALNIFKKYIVGEFDVSWGSITDDDISVYNIRDCVWDFMYTNDYDELCKTVLLNDIHSVVLYTSEKDTIEYVGYRNTNVYNVFDNNIDKDLATLYNIFRTCNINDIKNYLYISGDNVHCLKTFYKMFLLDLCFEISSYRPAKYLGDRFDLGVLGGRNPMFNFDRLCHFSYGASIRNNFTNTTFTINIKNKEYFFDFDVKGLSDDDFDNRINLYVKYLYEIDVERRIKYFFNLTIPDVIFQYAKKQNNLYERNESLDYDFIPLINFATIQLYCKKEFLLSLSTDQKKYQNVRMLFVIMKRLLSDNKEMYKYNININHVEHHKLIRNRQLNNIRGIDVDKSISDESYILSKEMFKYLWEFKDDIYKFSKKLGSDGKFVLKTYNDLLVIDNKVMEMSKKKDDPDFVKNVYDRLQKSVELFIDLLSEMVQKKEYVSDFIRVQSDVLMLYYDVMGKHNMAEFYN